jgi:hypothetical protein
MTGQQVFTLYRAYKQYFQPNSTYDIIKYEWQINTPNLLSQHDRKFYHRIAQKLNDQAVHGLFIDGFFFNPRAYVMELAQPEMFERAMLWVGRTENGEELLKRDLYALIQSWKADEPDLQDWLYGETIPGCLQQVIDRTLPLDIAALLLLIPHDARQFNWPAYWATKQDNDMGLGPQGWIDRLKKIDQLLKAQRPGWRQTSRKFATAFWNSQPFSSLAPLQESESPSLY